MTLGGGFPLPQLSGHLNIWWARVYYRVHHYSLQYHSFIWKRSFLDTWQHHRVMPLYLYIYKIVAILFLWTQTPPTILVIEGWNLGTNPAIVGGRPLTNFFEIGPRVPRLGPNFGQNLNKIAVYQQPLVRFGWNFDCRVIFEAHCLLKSRTKALKLAGAEILAIEIRNYRTALRNFNLL